MTCYKNFFTFAMRNFEAIGHIAHQKCKIIINKNRIMVKPTLLVLAAGMGSRYGSLKQMDGVGPNGEAIIDYSVQKTKHISDCGTALAYLL